MAKTPTARKTAETKSRKRTADDPAQYKRFREFAVEHGADESVDSRQTFDDVFAKIVPNKTITT